MSIAMSDLRNVTDGICILGKNQLGDIGFCLNKNKIEAYGKDAFLRNIDQIEQYAANGGDKKIIMTSMTEIKDIKLTGGVYDPIVAACNPKKYDKCLSPRFMLDAVCNERSEDIPVADFIVWKKNKIKVATFSKTAPVLFFEAEDGTKCLGTILVKPLIFNTEHIMRKIFAMMKVNNKNKVRVKLITCTDNEYDYIKSVRSGTISGYLRDYFSKIDFVTDYYFIYPVEGNENWLYQAKDVGNNVIICE